MHIRTKLIAGGAALVGVGLGMGVVIGSAHQDLAAPTMASVTAGFNEAGPVQRGYGLRMAEVTVRLRQCKVNYSDAGRPEVCAPWWMDADRLAGEMRDGIAALPDADRYVRLAERLRQYQITAEDYRSWACDLGTREMTNDCPRLTGELAGTWALAGIDLAELEPVRT